MSLCKIKCPSMVFYEETKNNKTKADTIMKKLSKQTGPDWFQELSDLQIAAADEIQACVADEIEERQFERCQNVLLKIGLSPIPEKTQVLEAIRFSRGNDLAFLVFLQQASHDSSLCNENGIKRKTFSYNQRLILSCICHLDMVTTLIELDKILPKPVSKPKHYKDHNADIVNEANRWFAKEESCDAEGNHRKQIIVDCVGENQQSEIQIAKADDADRWMDAGDVNAVGSQCNVANQIKFFHRPTSTAMFQFDYENIFATNFLADCGVVKNSINRALELEKYLTEDNAIKANLQDMWRLELQRWNEKQLSKMDELVNTDCTNIGTDKQKVLKLLRKGISLMRKNPKFVLASFPNVHLLPILKEWILQRFSFGHDKAGNEKRLKANQAQRTRLEKVRLVPRVKIPNAKCFGVDKILISMDKSLKMMKKRDTWINKYHNRLAKDAIEKSRYYWSTMDPYSYNTQRMKQIFFAYMPARVCDFDKFISSDL